MFSNTQKPKPFLVLTHSTFDSTMKKRDTVKAAAVASNSDGETKDNAEKTENGDETVAPENSKATEYSDKIGNEENSIEDVIDEENSTEAVNDEEKDATADDSEAAKKTTNGKKSSSDKRSSPRKFIRLTCVHCRTKSVKFQVNFSAHFYTCSATIENKIECFFHRNTQIICTRGSTKLRCGRWHCVRNRKSHVCAPLNARHNANWKRRLPTSKRNRYNFVCCVV